MPCACIRRTHAFTHNADDVARDGGDAVHGIPPVHTDPSHGVMHLGGSGRLAIAARLAAHMAPCLHRRKRNTRQCPSRLAHHL